MTKKRFNESVKSSRFTDSRNPYSIIEGVLNKKAPYTRIQSTTETNTVNHDPI